MNEDLLKSCKDKHLLKLAVDEFEIELKNSSFTDEEDRFHSVKYDYQSLKNIKQSLLQGRFYIRVDKVSKSGMSRNISMAYILNNKLHRIIDPFILKLAGCDKNGRVSGCGMDMLFHVQYTLFHALHVSYKKAHYQSRMRAYNDY